MKKYFIVFLLLLCSVFLFAEDVKYITRKLMSGFNYGAICTVETDSTDVNKDYYPYNLNIIVYDGPESYYSQSVVVRIYYKTKNKLLEDYQKLITKYKVTPDIESFNELYNKQAEEGTCKKYMTQDPSNYSLTTCYLLAAE